MAHAPRGPLAWGRVDLMRVFLYARVSMEDIGNEREQNPLAQLEPMRLMCKAMSWDNAGEFIDRETGSSKLRPEFRRMLLKLNAKEADTLMVWKLDRLNRFKALDAMKLIDELKQRGIAIKSLQEPWADTTADNPTAELLLYITAWVAEQERKNISKRTKAGIQAQRNAGGWKGGRPKGKKDTTPRARRWAIKPKVKIEEMFE